MRYLYSFLFACMFFLWMGPVKAQSLSIQERLEIILQSKQIIREYEILLNNLSDIETTETIGDILIRNSYSAGRNQIFFNQGVIVEDDIHPLRTQGKLPPEDVEVQQYLQDFALFYEKTDRRTISFRAIRELSDVEEGQYKFLRVYFESTFAGKHKDYATSYETARRVAEIRIEKEGNRWRPFIAGIGYFKEPVVATKDVPSIDTPTEEPEETSNKVVQDTPEELNQPVEGFPSDNPEEADKPVENGITFKRSEAYQFTYPNTATVKKRGSNLSITWMNQQKIPGPVELKLIRNGKPYKTLLPRFEGTSFGWNIDNTIKSGTYQLEVRSKDYPDTYGLSLRLRSGRVFPLWWAIGIPLVVGGAAVLIFAGDDGGGGPGPADKLPPAPDPGGN